MRCGRNYNKVWGSLPPIHLQIECVHRFAALSNGYGVISQKYLKSESSVAD